MITWESRTLWILIIRNSFRPLLLKTLQNIPILRKCSLWKQPTERATFSLTPKKQRNQSVHESLKMENLTQDSLNWRQLKTKPSRWCQEFCKSMIWPISYKRIRTSGKKLLKIMLKLLLLSILTWRCWLLMPISSKTWLTKLWKKMISYLNGCKSWRMIHCPLRNQSAK